MDSSSNNNKIGGNIFSQKYNFSEVNPFSADFNPQEVKPTQNTTATNPIKRLNGYDSAILNKTKYDEAETEDLSLEYRIKEKESIIKDLDSKLEDSHLLCNNGRFKLRQRRRASAKRQRKNDPLDR